MFLLLSPPVEALFIDRPLELLLFFGGAGADLDGVLRRVVRPRQADEDDAQRYLCADTVASIA